MVEKINPEPTKQVEPPQPPKKGKDKVPFSMVIKMAFASAISKVLRSWGKDERVQAAENKKASKQKSKEETEVKGEELKTQRLRKGTKHPKV